MRVRLRAFAQLRELLGDAREIELPAGAQARDVWSLLPEAARAHEPNTRIARNGVVVPADARLNDGDDIALLPPVSGG